MYNLYRLYGGDMNVVFVVYSKQSGGKKYSTMKRNAKNGMKGDEYDYIRKIGYDNGCLVQFYNQKCKTTADSLAQAKAYNIDNLRVLKDEVIDTHKKEIQQLQTDNEELEESKKEQSPEVNLLSCDVIKQNNINIASLNAVIGDLTY